MGARVAVLRGPRELLGDAGVVAEREQVGAAGPAGVFPLGFGGEPILVTGGKVSRLLLALRDRRAIVAGVEESDLLHRAKRVSGEMAGVASQDGQKFTLSDFIFPDPKITRDRHWVFDAQECAGFDGDHV